LTSIPAAIEWPPELAVRVEQFRRQRLTGLIMAARVISAVARQCECCRCLHENVTFVMIT
jgi:hypothetical protein